MKKFIYCLVLLKTAFACDSEEVDAVQTIEPPTTGGGNETEVTFYNVVIHNNTSSGLDLSTANVNGNPQWIAGMAPGDFSGPVEYEATEFKGIDNPWAEIRFDNQKGYYCDLTGSNNPFCDETKSLVHGTGFIQQPDGTWLFTITQDDYDNAFVLP